MSETATHSAALIAELNDLLQLDHDAVGAYGIAIEGIDDPMWKQDLIRYRGDHERHVRDLTELIRAHGGIPVELPHLPTGVFKSAVQAAGAAGGDREVLMAFKSNEGQVRDRYRRAAGRDLPADVAAVVARNARDEETHYRWVTEALATLGVGPDDAVGRAQEGFERVHGGVATMMERAERRMMQKAEEVRRNPRSALGPLLAVGVGALVLRRLIR